MEPNILLNVAKDSFTQLVVALFIGLIVFGILKIFKRKTSFAEFIGFKNPSIQMDKKFFAILFGLALFAIVTTYLQFSFSDTFRGFLTSDTSPYGRILKGGGAGILSLLSGFIYCFVSAGGSEEVIFRGLIAKNLFRWLGNSFGNIVQAFIFWLMHLLIFRFVTGEWFSWVQAFGFFMSFGLGLVLGYVNFRKNGESIWPSWIAHGTVNFATFLTLFFLF